MPSAAVCGVLGTQGSGDPLAVLGGVEVSNLTSIFAYTVSGLKRTSPAPSKPPLTVPSVMVSRKAALNPTRKSALLMSVTRALIIPLIWSPYFSFRTLKHPTSRGWVRWDEWAGRQRVMMFFALQEDLNSALPRLISPPTPRS